MRVWIRPFCLYFFYEEFCVVVPNKARNQKRENQPISNTNMMLQRTTSKARKEDFLNRSPGEKNPCSVDIYTKNMNFVKVA